MLISILVQDLYLNDAIPLCALTKFYCKVPSIQNNWTAVVVLQLANQVTCFGRFIRPSSGTLQLKKKSGSRAWKGPVSSPQLLIILGRLTSSNTFTLLILEKDFHKLTHKKVRHQFTDGLQWFYCRVPITNYIDSDIRPLPPSLNLCSVCNN